MKYDFTTVPNRRNTGSSKWKAMYQENPNVDPDVVPLSSADMEFFNAPEITKGLQDYVGRMVLGYTDPTDAYYDAVVNWMKTRHGYDIKKEWIELSPGVVPAFSMLIDACTEPGDGVLLMTPVYYPMSMSIKSRGRRLVENPLLLTEDGYKIDFEDLEAKAADPGVKALLFCSPHNPVGRVWTREELTKIMDICLRNHVFVIDDEIHNDLIMPGYEHTVMATLSEEAAMNCAVCTAPSKSFNLAGLQCSNIIIADPVKKAAFFAEKLKNLGISLNAIAYEGCRLAYTECGEWLNQCIQVVHENAEYIKAFMAEKLPEIKVFPLEGTYLLWADFRAWGMTHLELKKFMVEEAQIFTDEGYMFGDGGRGFERFNLACPTSVIVATMDRLYKAITKRREIWEREGKPEHTALKTGEKLPEFTYMTPYGEESSVSFGKDGKKTVLLFSRYYSCGLCQQTIAELQEKYDLIREKGAEVKVVMQSTPESIREALGDTNPYPFTFICDPEQKLYKRFEVFPADPMDMVGSINMKEMLMALAAAPKDAPEPEGNQLQLPAAFILDSNGIVLYADYAKTMDGLPSVEKLSALLG
ncbi:MAG: PatB family C-S lyase [Lachnospiraceae bacterium]